VSRIRKVAHHHEECVQEFLWLQILHIVPSHQGAPPRVIVVVVVVIAVGRGGQPVPHAVGVVIDLRAQVVRHVLPEGAGRVVAQGQHVNGDAVSTAAGQRRAAIDVED
jgi:hypothetical protein